MATYVAGQFTGATVLGWLLSLVLPACASAGILAVVTRGGPESPGRLAVALAAAAGVVLAVELAVARLDPSSPSRIVDRQRVAARLGQPFDARPKSAVVAELRRRGVDAHPTLPLSWPRDLALRRAFGRDRFPLANIAGTVIVECNEAGDYVSYRTDEFGFRNPPGLHVAGDVDIAAVGSTYTLGHCVPDGQEYVARLRAAVPRTLNVSMPAADGLTMLGMLTEYVEPLRPRVVLWALNPWATEVGASMRDPLLVRYLDEGFSQHLAERRVEFDAVLRRELQPLQVAQDQEDAALLDRYERGFWRQVLTLGNLRRELGLAERLHAPPPPYPREDYLRVTALAGQRVHAWGGQLVVLIIPTFADVVAFDVPPHLAHERLAGEVRRLGLPVIDAVGHFRAQPDPRGLYALGIASHPNAAGHAELARYVLAQLPRGG